MNQRQHAISEWLLKGFARATRGGPQLTSYDKVTTRSLSIPPSRFMAPINDHSAEIEAELSKIESAAATAAARLLNRARALPPGWCRIAGPNDPDVDEMGAGTREGGIFAGFRLEVVERQIRRMSSADTHAFARYAALMYSRSPKIEAAITRVGAAYVDGIRAWLRLTSGGDVPATLRRTIDEILEGARWHGLREADRMGSMLAKAQWWLLKAPVGREFVLGDSPVVATIALGHNDVWRPLLAPDTYLVVMPLDSVTALVFAPFLPGAAGSEDPVAAVNRLSWKWAERYVAGSDPDVVTAVKSDFDMAGWDATAPATADESAAKWRGFGFGPKFLVEELWRPRAPSHEEVDALLAVMDPQ